MNNYNLPHEKNKGNEYSIKVFKRYKFGKYCRFGKYVGGMKYVHHNHIENAIKHLQRQNLEFNRVEIFNRRTGEFVKEIFI